MKDSADGVTSASSVISVASGPTRKQTRLDTVSAAANDRAFAAATKLSDILTGQQDEPGANQGRRSNIFEPADRPG